MSVAVLAAGCVFPSGPGLGLADVAVETGFSLLRRHPFFVDRSGERVTVSCFDDASLGFDAARWPALAEAALADLLGQLGPARVAALDRRPWMLWVVLPDAARPAAPARLYELIEPVLSEWPYGIAEVRLRCGGHAAAVVALDEACAACSADPERPALVLAIDSQIGTEALMALEARDLLHGARHACAGRGRANPYGRIPGEGAAAILIGTGLHGLAWCELAGIAVGDEPRTFDQPEPCIGLGLSRCASEAIAAAGLEQDEVLTSLTHDATGEPYRADEYGFAAMRLAPRLAEGYRRVMPPIASGDLGTASALTHAALAAWRCRNAADGSAHLLLASSDDTTRGAIVLRAMHEVARWD